MPKKSLVSKERWEKKKEYDDQWRLDNPNYAMEYYYNNKARRSPWNSPESKRRCNLKYQYGLTEAMFLKLYEKQKQLCLGCDIKLITRLLPEEAKQYEDDPNLICGVDYDIAQVDHDHSFDIEGVPSGNPDSVRGLLCVTCNIKDVLNPESNFHIYGDDPVAKETLLKNRETNIILKQWHKEENS